MSPLPSPELSPWLQPRAPDARPALTLGAMNFGARTPRTQALAVLERAFERGLLFVDTANVYVNGESERIVGAAIAKRPDVAVATKVGLNRVRGQNEGLSAAVIHASVEASRKRLGRDVLDLLYLHAPDPKTPIEETVGALAQLVHAGAVRHWGVSNFASWQILELRLAAEREGLAAPAVSQVLYNLLVRQLDVEYFRFVERYPLHTTVYNPLAGGLLSGKHEKVAVVPPGSRFDGNAMYQRRYWTPRFFEQVEALGQVARDEGMSLVELSYAWLAGRRGVDSILVGPGSVAHLDAAIDGCARALSPEAETRIEALHREFVGTDASYAR